MTAGETATPTWGHDFKRLIFGTCIYVVLCTIVLALARTGLMDTSETSDIPVVADATFAGFLMGLPALLFLFSLVDVKRDDHGLRREGLVSLVLLAIPTSALIELLVAFTWTFIMGDQAAEGTVAAELPTDAQAMTLVFCFLVAGMAWISSLALALVTWIGWVSIVTVVAFLGGIGGLMFGGAVIFDSPPSLIGLLICLVLALTGLAVLAALAAFRPVDVRMTLNRSQI